MIKRSRVSITKKMLSVLLTALMAMPVFMGSQEQEGSDEEALRYKVSVNVMAVPIFAVDTKGEPVFDLREDELELFVNDQPVPILQFKRYEFGTEDESDEGEEVKSEEAKTAKTVKEDIDSRIKAHKKSEDRVMFVILDTMFNSLTGFRRSKEIVENLITEALPGDRFVILENSPISGLKYIAGPEKDRKVLVRKLNEIKPPPEKWNPNMFSERLLDNSVTVGSMGDPRLEHSSFTSHRELTQNSERYQYQNQVKQFTYVLGQFKYALKTIDKPKIVFLISEGIARGAFRAAMNKADLQAPDEEHVRYGPTGPQDSSGKGFYSILNQEEDTVFDQDKIYSAFMLKYLVDVVKSINTGGSVLYTINPRRMDDVNDRSTSGQMSLRYLASESGGKYFAGSKPEKIVERVKKTTSAYYEVFFQLIPDMGKNMTIRLECKRDGVNVHSLMHSERNVPYIKMEAVQKKIFALNVVSGGTWSRMVGTIRQVKYKKSKVKGKEKFMALTIPIPRAMQNKKADVFLVRMDPKTQSTQIDRAKQVLSSTATLQVKTASKANQFFVIIEPNGPYCVYNKI